MEDKFYICVLLATRSAPSMSTDLGYDWFVCTASDEHEARDKAMKKTEKKWPSSEWAKHYVSVEEFPDELIERIIATHKTAPA